MTIEHSVYVRLPDLVARHVVDLNVRAEAALRRSEKLPPGDRTEAIRFEALHATIDQLAIAAMANGEPHLSAPQADSLDTVGTSLLRQGVAVAYALPEQVSRWIMDGGIVVELRLPHLAGETEIGGEIGRGPPKPATKWNSAAVTHNDAVRERFQYLISQALADGKFDEAAIFPSGVTNTVLTEGLRQNVQVQPSGKRIDLPVRYRDGSQGPRFPLRVLNMTDRKPDGWRVLRFTLMSIRHVEMDVIVDGAWLRNSRVSQRRQAGPTDEIVFETSLRQLRRLDPGVPTLIFMYQTGLEPAIMGFYRAVVFHLIEYPRSIAVVPCFYQTEGTFVEGTTWAAA